MTALSSHQDSLHELADVTRSAIASSSRRKDETRQSAWVRRAINRAIAAFGSRADWSSAPAAHQDGDPDNDAAKFPRRPLILGDKWDF
jgi:hypothetical protein